MTRYLYYCPKCSFLGSAAHESPNEYQQCSECNATMIYTGLTKDEWDSKAREEKDLLKNQFKTELVSLSPIGKSGIDNDAILRSLDKMGHDISIIKTIMVVWVILNLIVALFVLLRIAGVVAELVKLGEYLH